MANWRAKKDRQQLLYEELVDLHFTYTLSPPIPTVVG